MHTLLLLASILAAEEPATTALTAEQVKAALKEKRGISYQVKTSMSAWRMGGELVAFVSTPYSRLTWLAQAARERFEEPSEEDIQNATADPSICVSTPASQVPVQSIVLLPRKEKEPTPANVIKSTETSKSIHDMYNKLGGQWKEVSYTACFPAAVKAQQVDVVVVYSGGKPIRGHLPKDLR